VTWLLVSAGKGPAECCLAVAHIAARLQSEAQSAGMTARVLVEAPGPEPDTNQSILVSLDGSNAEAAEALLATWLGTIQWTCPSPYRPKHRRKNWFVGVSRLDPPPPSETGLDERDVTFETMRASGPGGQHVNTTDSAVRATHRPSGLTVTATEERSQHRNRRLALARLAAGLMRRADAQRREQDRTVWIEHQNIERGNPVRIYDGITFERRR